MRGHTMPATGGWKNVLLEAFCWVKVQPGLHAQLHLQKDDPPWVELYKGKVNTSREPLNSQTHKNTAELQVGEKSRHAFGFELTAATTTEGRFALWFRPTIGPYTGTGK